MLSYQPPIAADAGVIWGLLGQPIAQKLPDRYRVRTPLSQIGVVDDVLHKPHQEHLQIHHRICGPALALAEGRLKGLRQRLPVSYRLAQPSIEVPARRPGDLISSVEQLLLRALLSNHARPPAVFPPISSS